MPTNRPNIVLCVMDDHQHDALGVCGHPVADTPFLDQLAERGTRFANARMPGGTSPAVCMPSRAMLHTGRPLFELEDAGARIPENHPTLGELLGGAGYTTFHTGKWHNDRASLHRAFASADEVFLGGMSDPWNTPLFYHDPEGNYDAMLPMIRDPMYSNEVKWRPGDHVHAGCHCTDVFCDRAARFLRDWDGERPLFLSVALMAPHDPRTAPPEYHARIDPASVPLPENFMESPPADTGVLDVRDEHLAAKPRQPDEVRHHIADYHAMIRHLDDGLGRIMAAVDAAGAREDTVFVFTSDHGLGLGQHGHMGKQNVYEHSIRVPLIVAGPGVPTGAVRAEDVLHLDLFATLARLGGAVPPEGVASRDLDLSETGGAARDAAEDPPERRYFAHGIGVRGYREGDRKLIEYAHGDYRFTELFDLREDPLELRNLAADAACADEVVRLRSAMRTAADAAGDPGHPAGEEFWAAMARDGGV